MAGLHIDSVFRLWYSLFTIFPLPRGALMSDLPKAYEAKKIDAKWYQFWEGNQFFKANPLSSKPAYCIVIPPPNVTGVLHMGHALVNTLQDILIRWKRMLGFEDPLGPGTDHAGIATQTVVERHLIRTQGKKTERLFPRRIPWLCLGMERKKRIADPRSAETARVLMRLVAPPLYDGRRE